MAMLDLLSSLLHHQRHRVNFQSLAPHRPFNDTTTAMMTMTLLSTHTGAEVFMLDLETCVSHDLRTVSLQHHTVRATEILLRVALAVPPELQMREQGEILEYGTLRDKPTLDHCLVANKTIGRVGKQNTGRSLTLLRQLIFHSQEQGTP